ncbi:KamA family radical SAM protein [Bdellovibrionota bacterium FG-2]
MLHRTNARANVFESLMDPNDPNCPVRLQSVPKAGELVIGASDLEDPLGEERDMPVQGITHRYPDRVLFYTTHNCPVYCRHCTRKRKVADPSSSAANKQIEEGLAYIEAHKEIRDVVVSGGDPLSNSDDRLEYICSRIRAMEHVQVFRLGTRNPVTLPQRITDNLAQMIKKYHPVYVHTHFNHPKECTLESFDACAKLADAGCVIHNQSVLLKGVNDKPEIFKELNHKLLMMRVRPYYIFQCDMAQGISHFRTPVQTGIDIIEHLRGWTSGMAVPHYVIDGPGGGGKIPILPEYVKSHVGKKWVVRNYQNKEFEYIEP